MIGALLSSSQFSCSLMLKPPLCAPLTCCTHAVHRSVSVVLGEDVTLSVESSGYPKPTYQWRKDGDRVARTNTTAQSPTLVLVVPDVVCTLRFMYISIERYVVVDRSFAGSRNRMWARTPVMSSTMWARPHLKQRQVRLLSSLRSCSVFFVYCAFSPVSLSGAKPVITRQPVSVTVEYKEAAEFTVAGAHCSIPLFFLV